MKKTFLIMLTALTSLFGYAHGAPKGIAGNLKTYGHTFVADPAQTVDNSYSYALTRTGSKGLLSVSFGKQENPAVEVDDSIVLKVEELIRSGRLYETDKAKAKWIKKHPTTAHSSETITIAFDADKKDRGNIIPSDEHRKSIEALDSYLAHLYKELTKTIPDGDMIVCSCSCQRHGMPRGETQSSYIKLKADKGEEPKVVRGEVIDDKLEEKEYPATAEDVATLHKMLSDLNVIKIKDYYAEQRMLGGMTFRVYVEFSSGEKINATWFTEFPDPIAVKTFHTIQDYLYNIIKRNK